MTELTAATVARIAGPIDTPTTVAILATGATEAELRQAIAWTAADDVMMDDMRPLPSGRVAELIEILQPLDDLDEAG